MRFVALGDSITLGMGDPMPDGHWRGWAGLLAQALGPPDEVEFHNLAESGALSYTLVARQLPRALELRPDLAAVIVGVNDTLRGSFNIARTGTALHESVTRLRGVGATVLTVRLPDPGLMLRLPRPLARPLGRRIRAVNTVVDALAQAHGTVHFDSTTQVELYDRRMWSVDRLHPSERGHRLLAGCFADLLLGRGFPIMGRPDPEPVNPPPTRWASTRWMATKGAKWVVDRSADLVPDLVALAASEWWHRLRGTARRLDQHLAGEVERLVSSLVR